MPSSAFYTTAPPGGGAATASTAAAVAEDAGGGRRSSTGGGSGGRRLSQRRVSFSPALVGGSVGPSTLGQQGQADADTDPHTAALKAAEMQHMQQRAVLTKKAFREKYGRGEVCNSIYGLLGVGVRRESLCGARPCWRRSGKEESRRPG